MFFSGEMGAQSEKGFEIPGFVNDNEANRTKASKNPFYPKQGKSYPLLRHENQNREEGNTT